MQNTRCPDSFLINPILCRDHLRLERVLKDILECSKYFSSWIRAIKMKINVVLILHEHAQTEEDYFQDLALSFKSLNKLNVVEIINKSALISATYITRM